MNLKEQRIIVTGGAGFLGSHVVERLRKIGCEHIFVPRTSTCDLTDGLAVRDLFASVRPTLVMHLAARVGGIGANQKNPGSYFYQNMMMGMHILEQARLFNTEKVVLVGTICAYPKFAPIPFREEDLWNGFPEETNAPYGIAKKGLLVMADAYHSQYGLDSVCLLPVNLYGPRDNFDLESSHVIPGMIRKFIEATEAATNEVVLWGDGSPTREFLYVEDCAEAILLATRHSGDPSPVNVGAGVEVSISSVAQTIAELVGFKGKITWDTSRPNGQPRRCLDVSRAESRLGFRARTPFVAGLKQTIEWYRAAKAQGEKARTSHE